MNISRRSYKRCQYHCVLLGRRNWQEDLGAGGAGVGNRLRCHRLYTPPVRGRK